MNQLSILAALCALAPACAPTEAGVATEPLLALAVSSSAPAASSGTSSSSTGGVTTTTGAPTGVFVDRGRTPARPPGREAGCDGTRVIGQRSDSASMSCPAPTNGNWRGRLLFDPSVTANPDRRGAVLGSDGGAFCLYEWIGHGTPELAGLPSEAIYERRRRDDVGVPVRTPREWLQSDCAAVVPLGDTSDAQLDVIARAHRDVWRTRMDRPATLPSIPRLAGATGLAAFDLPATTEVALLDTSPDSGLYWPEPTQGEDLHGRAMGLFIDDLMCPQGRAGSGACAHFTHTYEVIGDTERPSSQSAAYIGRLAERIVEATRQRWGSRLVINLSVGFHPHYAFIPTSDDVRFYRLATRALMAALNYASLQGALVIVAAGNAEGHEAGVEAALGSGPLFPGELATAVGWNYDAARTTRMVPLAYAASALDSSDRDAPTTRAGSTSRYAAPGTMAAVLNRADGVVVAPEPIQMLTGSSVAAAALSGVAGLVWAYAPDLSPADVMNAVYDAGVDLRRPSAICQVGPDGNCRPNGMHRIDACAAVSRALIRAYGITGRREYATAWSSLSCATRPADSTTRPTLPASLFSSLDTSPHPVGVMYSGPVSDECLAPSGLRVPYAEVGLSVPTTGLSYCPLEASGNGIGAVALGPQPPTDPCTFCALKRIGVDHWVLYADLNPAIAGDLGLASLLGLKGALLLGDSVEASKAGELVAVDIPVGAFYVAEGEEFVTLSFPDEVKDLARVSVIPVYR